MKTDGRQYQAGEDMDARVKRLEAECERLRPDAFTLSLRELQHGLNCLSVDNELDRPDFQLAWDIYEAAKQCATPPPESEPHHVPPIVNNTPDGKPDEIPNDAPHTPEQTGDALAALDRILLRGDNAKCGDFQIVRKALTDRGVPEEDAAHDKGKAEGIRAGWNAGYAQGHNDAKRDHGHAQLYTLPNEDILKAAESMKREALASAPANWMDVLEREDWGLVPISVPTGGDDYDVEWTVIEYHMAAPTERVIGRGRTPREALIASAPTDGRE